MASPYAIDFSPLANALQFNKQMELQRNKLAMEQERHPLAMANLRLSNTGALQQQGFAKELHPYEVSARQQQAAQAKEAAQQRLAQRGIAFITSQAENFHALPPEDKARHWETLRNSALFDADDKKLFDDPVYGPMWKDPDTGFRMLNAIASKHRDPLDKRALTAKAGEDEASARLKDAQAAAAGVKQDTFDLGPDHTRYQQTRQPDGSIVARPVATGAPAQDATAKKAIDEADDFIMQNKSALGSLKEALQLNEKAYDGVGASGRAYAQNNVWSTESAKATALLENVVTNQAVQSLRSAFGGNPTEGERKILLEVAGSVNQTREVRKEIYQRAQAAAEARLQFNAQKAQSLRSGDYYKTGGQPQQISGAPAAPQPQMRAQVPQQSGQPPAQGQIHSDSIRLLQQRANDPDVVRQFEERYGPGSSKQFLMQR